MVMVMMIKMIVVVLKFIHYKWPRQLSTMATSHLDLVSVVIFIFYEQTKKTYSFEFYFINWIIKFLLKNENRTEQRNDQNDWAKALESAAIAVKLAMTDRVIIAQAWKGAN